MSNILVTGGTVFVGKYIAEYFMGKGENVFVFNRNKHKQLSGVKLIKGNKDTVCAELGNYSFDLVITVNIYTEKEMENLINGLGEIKDFVFISSGAVYPETAPQPFKESCDIGYNTIWKDYGINKAKAEQYLT